MTYVRMNFALNNAITLARQTLADLAAKAPDDRELVPLVTDAFARLIEQVGTTPVILPALVRARDAFLAQMATGTQGLQPAVARAAGALTTISDVMANPAFTRLSQFASAPQDGNVRRRDHRAYQIAEAAAQHPRAADKKASDYEKPSDYHRRLAGVLHQEHGGRWSARTIGRVLARQAARRQVEDAVGLHDDDELVKVDEYGTMMMMPKDYALYAARVELAEELLQEGQTRYPRHPSRWASSADAPAAPKPKRPYRRSHRKTRTGQKPGTKGATP